MARNEGKIFEDAFIKSVPDYCWHKRLNDNASSWANGSNTRFTSTNECDFLLFDCKTKTLNALELKTTKSNLTSLSRASASNSARFTEIFTGNPHCLKHRAGPQKEVPALP